MFNSREIDAMNTKISIVIISDNNTETENEIDAIEKYIKNFELKFSRFLNSSELLKLNNSKEESIVVSKEMTEILSLSKVFYKKTNKIFDPTILNTLEKIGYDKSFELINDIDNRNIVYINYTKSFDEVNIDIENNIVTKPINMKIDLGGIGKGYAIDNIAKKLYFSGYNNFWISAGGDVFLSGKDEKGDNWDIGVQNPLKHDQDLFKIQCLNKKTSIATSGITKRNWGDAQNKFNHIIDPRIKTSVKNDILSATVVSDNTATSDVFAKTVLILGKEKGLEFINNEKDSECIIIDKNLDIFLSKNADKCLITI